MYSGLLAGILVFAAYILYIRSVYRGNTQPSATTWSIWAGLGTLICLSYFASGARETLWVAVSNALGPLIILGLRLWHRKKIVRKDPKAGWTRNVEIV